MLPLRELLLMSRKVRLGKLVPQIEGMEPVRPGEFELQSKEDKKGRVDAVPGKEPPNLLKDMSIFLSFVIVNNSEGMFPRRKFRERSIFWSEESRAIWVGILPVKELLYSSKTWSLVSSPRRVLIVPVSLFP